MIAVVLIAEDRGWKVTVRAMVQGASVRVDRWFASRAEAVDGQRLMLAQLGVTA